jgi:putative chitinase
MSLITADILQLIATRNEQHHTALETNVASHWSALLNEVCPWYGIKDKSTFEEFISQVLHETDCFRIKEENLNYTKAERLMEVWPLRFRTTVAASLFLHAPVELANHVYRGRLGNVKAGDGWLFRGRGLLQITGRTNYTLYHNFKKAGMGFPAIGLPDRVEEMADLLATNDLYALDSALWEFAVDKKLLTLALKDQFLVITRHINGGTVGIQAREYYYTRAKRFLAA